MLDEDDFHGVCAALAGRNLQAGWWSTESFTTDFDIRKKIFLELLERLLNEDHIKLAKHGHFLEGTVEEQVERFRQTFPKTEEAMEDGFWFFDEECPGGAVWVLEDGSLEWT